MKKDFESRFMPNAKFLLPKQADARFWFNLLKITKLDNFDNYIGFCTNAFGDIIYNGFENIESFNNCCSVHSYVSIYEAIPELIPDGMRYNKELDKLVPDVIAEYVKDITIPCDKVKEEMLQRENGFIKADKEKTNFSLVDPYAYEDLGKCLTIGAKKYDADNWKLGDIESYISALDRHLLDIKKAVLNKDKSLFIDKDTTLQHGANLICNAMFIHYFIRKELEEK